MLAALFLAYGAGLWIAADHIVERHMWIRLMAVIQLIDLGAGGYYTLNHIVPLSLSGFPLFNAAWIAMLTGLMPIRATQTFNQTRPD